MGVDLSEPGRSPSPPLSRESVACSAAQRAASMAVSDAVAARASRDDIAASVELGRQQQADTMVPLPSSCRVIQPQPNSHAWVLAFLIRYLSLARAMSDNEIAPSIPFQQFIQSEIQRKKLAAQEELAELQQKPREGKPPSPYLSPIATAQHGYAPLLTVHALPAGDVVGE